MRLRRLGARAVLTVVDDGVGFEVPDDLEELAGGRHFGVGGMRERALLVGRRPERRVGARRRLRAVGLGADGGRPARVG